MLWFLIANICFIVLNIVLFLCFLSCKDSKVGYKVKDASNKKIEEAVEETVKEKTEVKEKIADEGAAGKKLLKPKQKCTKGYHIKFNLNDRSGKREGIKCVTCEKNGQPICINRYVLGKRVHSRKLTQIINGCRVKPAIKEREIEHEAIEESKQDATMDKAPT